MGSKADPAEIVLSQLEVPVKVLNGELRRDDTHGLELGAQGWSSCGPESQTLRACEPPGHLILALRRSDG